MRIAIRLATIVAILYAACAILVAQTSSTEKQSAEKTHQLLPSLDKQLMDTTADPCVDFFQYSCGNFSKLYPIPNDRPGFGTGTGFGQMPLFNATLKPIMPTK